MGKLFKNKPEISSMLVKAVREKEYNIIRDNAVGPTTSTTLRTVTAHNDTNCIYVAPNGANSNPGTQALPKLTIQAGIDQALGDGKSIVTVIRNGYVGEMIFQEQIKLVADSMIIQVELGEIATIKYPNIYPTTTTFGKRGYKYNQPSQVQQFLIYDNGSTINYRSRYSSGTSYVSAGLNCGIEFGGKFFAYAKDGNVMYSNDILGGIWTTVNNIFIPYFFYSQFFICNSELYFMLSYSTGPSYYPIEIYKYDGYTFNPISSMIYFFIF